MLRVDDEKEELTEWVMEVLFEWRVIDTDGEGILIVGGKTMLINPWGREGVAKPAKIEYVTG